MSRPLVRVLVKLGPTWMDGELGRCRMLVAGGNDGCHGLDRDGRLAYDLTTFTDYILLLLLYIHLGA